MCDPNECFNNYVLYAFKIKKNSNMKKKKINKKIEKVYLKKH